MTTPAVGSTIAGNVRAEMARQRRKGTELAAVMGLSQAAVSRRLTGETPLDVNELFTIAAWLDVPVTDLIPGGGSAPMSGWSGDIQTPLGADALLAA